MLGDIFLKIISMKKQLSAWIGLFIKENTCIHDYDTIFWNSVRGEYKCKKCGRHKITSH